MNPVSEDIKDLFVANQVAYFIGDTPQNPHSLTWACGVAYEPKEPDSFITIYDTGGIADTITNDYQYEAETVQIRLRCNTYLTGWTKIRAIRTYLNNKGKTIPSGESYRYEGFFQESAILPIGKDENSRFLFTVNYRGLRYVIT